MLLWDGLGMGTVVLTMVTVTARVTGHLTSTLRAWIGRPRCTCVIDPDRLPQTTMADCPKHRLRPELWPNEEWDPA
jgi:hypothetical protein